MHKTLTKKKIECSSVYLLFASTGDPNDRCYTENCQLLQRLIDITCGDGVVYFPENHLNSKVSNQIK